MKTKMKQSNDDVTLLHVYDDDLRRLSQRVGKDRAESTLRSLRQGRGYVAAFLVCQQGRADIPLGLLTPQLIHDFASWLGSQRGLRGGTVWLACQQLKGVVTRAHQRGLLSWNPFAGFHIAKNIRPREYLTEDELRLLMTHAFEDARLRFARDVFVFAAFTGLSFIDIRELRPDEIVSLGDDRWIVARRHKTRVPYQVKLLSVPLAIVGRYQKAGAARVFGRLEYRTQTKRLQRVAEACGLRRRITMHLARHTFAVMALNRGMPIESVSRILGHTNITTTQIYAKITMQKLGRDLDDLAARLSDLHLIK